MTELPARSAPTPPPAPGASAPRAASPNAASPNAASPKPRAVVRTYGCQMNAYDSARMADVLAQAGYEAHAADGDGALADADLVVLNTCHIREKAAEKVYSELGRVKEAKEARAASGRSTQVVVAGCVAQAEGAELARRAPVVDVVVGPQGYQDLPALLARAASQRAADGVRPSLKGAAAPLSPGLVHADLDVAAKFARLPARRAGVGPSAFVTVQEGCDKFCAFCVVPYTRGAEVSRPVAAVLGEVRALAEAGAREVTLIGQNVNAYRGADEAARATSLAVLLERCAAVPGIARLRYTTSHPLDMSEDLIAAHRDLPALMPYLHLPVQSGSDAVLKRMNRRHGADAYRRIVERVRAARPDVALTSDFIVGFPGETDADHRATVDLAREVGFAMSFAFKYSRRPGTPAADRDGQVPEPVKAARLAELQATLEESRVRFDDATIGRTCDVLVEKPGRHGGQMSGKTPWLQQAVIENGETLKPGDIVPVRIEARRTFSLSARCVTTNHASCREAA